MKHKIIKRAGLVLAMCVACVLAIGATFAQATTDSGLGGPNVLVVNVANPESEIKDASVKVNLYRIATGSKDAKYDTYNNTFDVQNFAELGEGYDPATMTADSWQKMAEAAQKIVEEKKLSPDVTADAGEEITGLPHGLYLVLTPDTTSSTKSFTFTPAIVALPGKVGADGSAVYNTGLGTWTNATDPVTPVNVVVKWSMEQRYGKLQINKTATGFSGEPVTFSFYIAGYDGENLVYENHAAVQYTAEGVQSTEVGHIPAGLNIVVYEEDDAPGYQLVSEDGVKTVIVADDTVEVSFENTKQTPGTSITGHGIENHFVFDEKTGDWYFEARTIDESEYISNNQ